MKSSINVSFYYFLHYKRESSSAWDMEKRERERWVGIKKVGANLGLYYNSKRAERHLKIVLIYYSTGN